MESLKLVLLFKILLTFIFWSLPQIVFPPSWLIAIGFPDPGAMIVFMRLLGSAYFALDVGYVLGYRTLGEGKDIGNVVAVGIISNSLACIVLLIFGIQGRWNDWGTLAQVFMWGSTVVTGLIVLGLTITGRRSVNLKLL
jgi:hypothetical protein